jgi:hypothetical protein
VCNEQAPHLILDRVGVAFASVAKQSVRAIVDGFIASLHATTIAARPKINTHAKIKFRFTKPELLIKSVLVRPSPLAPILNLLRRLSFGRSVLKPPG